MKTPTHLVTGNEAIMHAAISGVTIYSLQRPGPVPLSEAMTMHQSERVHLFAAVDSLPSVTDRQMIDTKTSAYADLMHQKDMRILTIVALCLIIISIIFSMCLIVPRLV